MEEKEKDELTRQFRDYLDHDFPEQGCTDEIDQLSLFNELAGLKNEVKIESRQLKNALDDFRQAFTSLDTGQQELVAVLRTQRQGAEPDTIDSMPVILGLIDLYDRIDAGLEQEMPAPTFLERLMRAGRRSRRWLRGYLEGQRMVLGRVSALLESCGATGMDTAGQQFNPKCMKAVGFAWEPTRQEGEVLREIRKGFCQDLRIIRPAEVIVNKEGEAV